MSWSLNHDITKGSFPLAVGSPTPWLPPPGLKGDSEPCLKGGSLSMVTGGGVRCSGKSDKSIARSEAFWVVRPRAANGVSTARLNSR